MLKTLKEKLKDKILYFRKSKRELIKNINTLENENETLKEDLKNNIVNEVLKNYDKILKYEDLVKENKRLRKLNKKLRNQNN